MKILQIDDLKSSLPITLRLSCVNGLGDPQLSKILKELYDSVMEKPLNDLNGSLLLGLTSQLPAQYLITYSQDSIQVKSLDYRLIWKPVEGILPVQGFLGL